MSNPTVVIRVPQVAHDPHYRTTLTGVGITTEVFIELTSVWQVKHPHRFEDLDRSGSGHCIGCGAHAWCESWVADGYQGEHTHLWADELYRSFMQRVEADRADVERMRTSAHHLPYVSTMLVADLDPSQPA